MTTRLPITRTWAHFSPCGLYRLVLVRQWSDDAPLVMVGLNPSTATAEVDDPTIRRGIGFGQSLGFGRLVMVNLFAFRATQPADLRKAGWPVGADNDEYIRASARDAIAEGGEVCCAWGDDGRMLARTSEVIVLLRRTGARLMCLGTTKHNMPRHPLYLAASSKLRPYEP